MLKVHGKSSFRASGGNPGKSNVLPGAGNVLPEEAAIKGNRGSKKGCACWNVGGGRVVPRSEEAPKLGLAGDGGEASPAQIEVVAHGSHRGSSGRHWSFNL